MNSWLILLVGVSAAASLFGYWRVFRLHRRILTIEPHFRSFVTCLLDRLFPRKDPQCPKDRP